jgi:hypothetical protein
MMNLFYKKLLLIVMVQIQRDANENSFKSQSWKYIRGKKFTGKINSKSRLEDIRNRKHAHCGG